MKNANVIADKLGNFLADSYLLYLKTQSFHWNVTGPHFHSLHKMFEEEYVDLAAAVDLIAERIRALGFYAPGSFTHYLKLSMLKEQPTIPADMEMIKELLNDHETLQKHALTIFGLAQESDDEVTMDLMIERMNVHEKTAWMLRSSLPK